MSRSQHYKVYFETEEYTFTLRWDWDGVRDVDTVDVYVDGSAHLKKYKGDVSEVVAKLQKAVENGTMKDRVEEAYKKRTYELEPWRIP
jgi:hypothetical protein